MLNGAGNDIVYLLGNETIGFLLQGSGHAVGECRLALHFFLPVAEFRQYVVFVVIHC